MTSKNSFVPYPLMIRGTVDSWDEHPAYLDESTQRP